MIEATRGSESNYGDAFAVYLAKIEEGQSDINIAAITLQGEELQDFMIEVVHELEEVCPFGEEEMVFISGIALMPDLGDDIECEDDEDFTYLSPVTVLDRDEDEGTVYGKVEGITGGYQGCSIQGFSGEHGKEYRIRHTIEIGSATGMASKGTRIRKDTLFGFFESDSTILPVNSVEKSLCPVPDCKDLPSEAVAQIIDGYSVQLVRLLNDTGFRRMPLARQQGILYELIKKAEQESNVQGRYVRIEFTEPNSEDKASGKRKNHLLKPTRHIYIPHATTEGPVVRRESKIPIIIGGICVGIETVERPQLRRRAFRRDRDMLDKKAGLCLVLDPDYGTTSAVSVGQDQLIYVPVSGQRFDAEFLSTSGF